MKEETVLALGEFPDPAAPSPAAEAPPDPAPPPAPPPRPVIRAACELYVCRVCRTKTGWPHQIGCEAHLLTDPGCGDCRYWSEKKDKCDHPERRKGGERR